MIERIPQVRLLGAVLVVAIAGTMGACGGAQSRDAIPTTCTGLDSTMASDRMERMVACYAQKDPQEVAAMCRDAAAYHASLSSEAIRVVTECTLAAQVRGDGAWLAGVLADVRDRPDALNGIVAAMDDHFDVRAHSNSFAAAIGRDAQTAVGERLEQMSEPLRRQMVSLGFAYNLDPLRDFALPHLRELDPGDPAIAAYAESLNIRPGEVGEEDRWVLVASGRWTADDVLQCFRGEQRGCEDWDGESPLDLLELTPDEMEINPGPNRALQMIERQDVSNDEISSIARWIGRTRFDTQDHAVGMLLMMLTDIDRDEAQRAAIARGATGSLCDMSRLPDYVHRVYGSARDQADNPQSPWALFVATCAQEWGPFELFAALGFGSRFTVPESVRSDLRDLLDAATDDDRSCETLRRYADDAYAHLEYHAARGLIYVEAARLGGESCDGTFRGRVAEIARDRAAHPDARLAAVAYALDMNDSSLCGEIEGSMNWREEESGMGPGPRAESLASTLRSRCR